MHWAEPKVCGCVDTDLGVCGEDRDLDVKDVKAHRTQKQKKAMTEVLTFVVEGNEKADELAKAGADVN